MVVVGGGGGGGGGLMLMTIHAHIYNKTFSEFFGEVKYNNHFIVDS